MSTETKPLARLREPFGPEHVGKLPRITCKNCSDARGRCCNEHRKSKCVECDNWITERHIHLDYVGHGAVTSRLLEVDPEWSWEPLAFDEQSGMPVFIYDNKLNPVSFWIRLTICGVTRLGVGTCEAGKKDAEKILIGDALRNAAMRFGVALDLWIKGHSEDDEAHTAVSEESGPNRSQRSEPGPAEQGVTAKDIGVAAAAAFASAVADTPDGEKGKLADRLRHAVVHIATNGRVASAKDCTPAELAGIYARLQRIETGEVPYTVHENGVTFHAPAGQKTVPWADFEIEPGAEPREEGMSQTPDDARSGSRPGDGHGSETTEAPGPNAQPELLPDNGKKATDEARKAMTPKGEGS